MTDRAARAERELRTLLANLPGAAAFVVDHEMRYLTAEGHALEAAGLHAADVVGRTVREVMGLQAELYEDHYRQALAGGTFSVEHAAHGRWFLTRGVPLRDDGGRIYAALAFSHDITERKAAEERVQRSQETFFGLVRHAPFGIYVVDSRLRLVHVSDGARKVFAQVAPPLIGSDFVAVIQQLWPEPFASDVLNRFRHTLASGEAFRAHDTRQLRQDTGDLEAYDWQLFRVTLPDASDGVVCYFYDATQLMAVHDRVRQSEQRLQLALQAAELGAWDWDVASGTITWDARTAVLFALDPATPATFASFEARLHPDDRQANRIATERALAAGDYVNEFRVCLPDGSERRCVGRAVVLRDGEGRALRVIGVTQDVTAARLEETRRRNQAERDAFTVALEGVLRPLADPRRMKAEACGLLGRALQVQRVHYGEFDVDGRQLLIEDGWDDGVGSVDGRWRVADFGILLHGLPDGERVRVEDVAALEGMHESEIGRLADLQVAAFVGQPLVKAGRCRAMLAVNCRRARRWTEEQLWRIEATAERTWAAVERARAEQALAAAEQRYRAFIAQSSEGIWRIEFEPPVDTRLGLAEQVEAVFRDGRFAECNDQMARLHGLADATALVGRGLGFMQPRADPADDQPADRFVAGFVAAGYRAVDVESRARNADGHERWFLNSLHGVVEDGRLLRVWGTQREVTERKAEQAALHASDARFRLLVSIVTDVPWTADASGAFIEPQPAWQAYTGQTFQQHRGLGWLDAIHADDRARVTANWQQARGSAAAFFSYGRLWHAPSGEHRHVVVRAASLADPTGAVHAWVGACNDVHDERRSNELLREADRRKDAFMATLAHELRNPLAPVRTAAALLQMPGLDAHQTARACAVIERQTLHMALLLDDLLDIARITQGKLVLKPQRLLLQTVVESAIEAARPLLEERRHALHVALPEHPVSLQADPVRLVQVLANLLSNAAHYTPAGGRIELRAALEGRRLRLDVRDNGIGIGPEALKSIFGMFVQGPVGDDAASRGALPHAATSLARHQGLGIGLAIVQGLVELHGGSVEAASEGPGRGSCFTIRLPLADEPAGAAAAIGAVPAAGSDRATRALRVLVVDDNRDAADMLAGWLSARGHQALVVPDGLAALEAADSFKPHAALLDIGMPGLNGYRVAERLRSNDAGTVLRLAALTGWGQDADRHRAFAAGFDAHFTKPVDLVALLSWVEGA